MGTRLTRYSLLRRATNTEDAVAWNELQGTYKNFIYHILSQMKVHPNDIEDVVQLVMIQLSKSLDQYDQSKGKFRTWFGQMIKNSAIAYFRKKNTLKAAPNLSPTDDFSSIDQSVDESFHLAEEKEWQNFILNLAMQRVEKSFSGSAIEAFQYSLEGKSTQEIASLVGVKYNSVFTLIGRVKQSLAREISLLREEMETEF